LSGHCEVLANRSPSKISVLFLKRFARDQAIGVQAQSFDVEVLLCFWAWIVARDNERQSETYAMPLKILPAVRKRIFGSIF
jgi:hypothetical protein